MLQPLRRRTWAPRGQPPRQKVAVRHHRRVSAIGAVSLSPQQTRAQLYFNLTTDSFTTERVCHFLRQLHRQLRRKVIIIWDRLNAHRSAANRFASEHPDWFQFEWLPAYSPELNPVEFCWSHTKYHELANFAPENVTSLEAAVASCLGNKHRHQSLLHAWLNHAKVKTSKTAK